MSDVISGTCDNCGIDTELLEPYKDGYWCKHCLALQRDLDKDNREEGDKEFQRIINLFRES